MGTIESAKTISRYCPFKSVWACIELMGKILRHAQNISTNEEDIDELENKLKEAKYILSVSFFKND
jgi:hypothetical protein